MRVYFGGTFDPPHKAHAEILKYLLADPWVTHVHIVPTNLNPFKTESLFSNENRLKLLDYFLSPFAGFKGKWTLEPMELQRDPTIPSYTIDSLRILIEKTNDRSQWVLCVGSDTLFDFHKWKDVAELKKLLSAIWVVPRGETWPSIEGVPQRILAGDYSAWSSTQIRDAIKNKNQELLKEALDGKVFSFLKEGFI